MQFIKKKSKTTINTPIDRLCIPEFAVYLFGEILDKLHKEKLKSGTKLPKSTVRLTLAPLGSG